MESGRFLPIKIGEGGFYFGKDDLFFLLCNYLPIGPLLGVLSYSIGGEGVGSWENLHLYHKEPIGSFVWWSCRSGKEALG